jgi:molecular chaperone DnaK
MTENKKVYGIDLGTTFSAIAVMDEYARPSIIPNQEGSHITPSVILFAEDGSIVVGDPARNAAVDYPDRIVEMVKRQMGVADWAYEHEGTVYRAEELSSFILRKVVQDAEAMTGEQIKDVVITCPAYFGTSEREATAKAGEIAGLNVRSVISEPTAAAISFGLHKEKDQNVLVYDLGGGTFDVTLIEIHGGELIVRATGGNARLGGKDWDTVIMNYLAEQWQEVTGSDEQILEDDSAATDLMQRAEKAKKALTGMEKTEVRITFGGASQRIPLTRELFDQLTEHLLEQTIMYTKQVLDEAANNGVSVDMILLVGGSTRMKQVEERLKKEFGLEIVINDPDESVAKGAAWYGQKLAIDEAIQIHKEKWGENSSESAVEAVSKEFGLPVSAVQKAASTTVGSVTSQSFGVYVQDGSTVQMIVANLILKNTRLPMETSQTFGTVEENQPNAEIRIMENNYYDKKVDPEQSVELGTALLTLPRGLPKGSPIKITFQLNIEGRLHVEAEEMTGHETVAVDIKTENIISEAELEQAKKRSSALVIN